MSPAVRAAILGIAILGSSCTSETEPQAPASVGDSKPSQVAHLFLDDVVAAQDGDDFVTLYFRALDAYRENVELAELRGLLVEDSGEALGDAPVLVELGNTEDEGISTVVVLDHSRVTAEDDALEQSKAAILELIDHIEGLDWSRHELAAVTFANDRQLLVSFDASADEARDAIRALQPDAEATDAALLDGVDFALETLRAHPDNPRRSLALLISDGKHNLEQPNDEERKRVLQPRINAIVAASARDEDRPTVLIHSFGHPIPSWHEDHIDLLDEISSETGGEYLRTRKVSELGALLVSVWDEANRSVKGLVRARMDGELHRLSLRVGRRVSQPVVLPYPKHLDIGAREVLLGMLGLVVLAFGAWIVYLRRPGRLELTNRPDAEPIRVYQGETRIGASANNDVRLSGSNVSEFHAMITMRGRTVFVENLDSENSTFVNGEEMQRRSLESGDRLRFGDVEARYER